MRKIKCNWDFSNRFNLPYGMALKMIFPELVQMLVLNSMYVLTF